MADRPAMARPGGQVQRLGQANEADTQMLHFLEGCQQVGYRATPVVQTPDQHQVNLAAASGV